MHSTTMGAIRGVAVVVFGVLLGGVAGADCPGTCVPGGGPAATDCFVQWSGVPGPTTVNVACTDGDASCDLDSTVDGVCTFGLQACLGAAGTSCPATALTGPPTVTPTRDLAAQELASALAAIDLATGGCTAPGIHVPLKLSLAGIVPGRARFTVVAAAGSKRDRDKVKLTCQPSPVVKSFANDVQPILTSRCATPACHTAASRGGGQNLEPDAAYGDSVNARSAGDPKLVRVKPGNLRQSFMARKLLAMGIPKLGGGAVMPLGCPGLPPAGGCLGPGELYTILSWIKTGALNN